MATTTKPGKVESLFCAYCAKNLDEEVPCVFDEQVACDACYQSLTAPPPPAPVEIPYAAPQPRAPRPEVNLPRLAGRWLSTLFLTAGGLCFLIGIVIGAVASNQRHIGLFDGDHTPGATANAAEAIAATDWLGFKTIVAGLLMMILGVLIEVSAHLRRIASGK